MQKIINGKLYSTETAQVVCAIGASGYSVNDLDYEDTNLYLSPKGQFFIAGRGGALTRWAYPVGGSGTTGGDGLELVDRDEARRMCEQYGTAEDFVRAFGPPEEG